MLRGPRQAGIDMIAPSDARAIYLEAVARGEKTPVAYVVGSHPCDFMAAVSMTPPMDELEVLGALRGAPVPVVKCVTNDIYVPADAEYVLEGYLDNKGHTEPEGPYGEYVGYYGIVKRNPVFHLTAITHRKDALFQTVTIGGKSLARTDTAQLTTVKTESAAWAALSPRCASRSRFRDAIERRHVQCPRFAAPARAGRSAQRHRRGVRHHGRGQAGVRVRRRHRRVLRRAVRLGAGDALPGRPRHHRATGFRVVPLDPSLGGARTGAKIGFDCTIPFGKRQSLEWGVPMPPVVAKGNGKSATASARRSMF